jgi:hypothetical protein
MSHHLEEAWYFMNAFNAIGFLVLVVLATAWLRWLLHILEDTLAPLREREQKSVHPRVEPTNVVRISQGERPAELETELEGYLRQEEDNPVRTDDAASAALPHLTASVHDSIGRRN